MASFDVRPLQIQLSRSRLMRNRLLFTIAVAAMYEPLRQHLASRSTATYGLAFLFTLIAIWLPRRFRSTTYYICVGLGALALGLWEWVLSPPTGVATNSFIPAIILLAGAPPHFRKLSIGLTSAIVLLSIVSGTYPENLWASIAQIGIYMGVVSIRGRREMEDMRQHYVAELESTLSELREAHAKLEADATQSMHYAAQAERFRIAREIHDGLGHQLTSLIVQLQAFSYMIPDSLIELREKVPQMLDVARAGLTEVRRSVRDWEETDDSYGLAALAAVIEQVKSTTHLSVKFSTNVGDKHLIWPLKVKVTLYRVLQETLANTVRHSNATHVDIRLYEDRQQVSMTIRDNGSTLQATEFHPGFGLRSMKSRCEEIGGDCAFAVCEDGGVRVTVTLPLGEMTTDDVL